MTDSIASWSALREAAHCTRCGLAWITVHPSYLLRIRDRDAAAQEYARFVGDLRKAADMASEAAVAGR